MFGVVPKVLWKKRAPPDRLNRIHLGLNCLLIRDGGRLTLIDAGMGTKDDARFRRMFALRQDPPLAGALARIGVAPEQIDRVILTHLHFDHTGGSTRIGPGGTPVPTFPRARYTVQRGEWEDATHPTERTRASYLGANFLPLAERGVVDFVDGDAEIAPGVRVVVTGGHTRHHQAVTLESRGRRAIFWGDLIPTSAHIDYPYIMGYDLDPVQTLAKKKELLPRVVEEGWLSVWEHDAARPCGRIRFEGKRAVVEPWTDGHAPPPGDGVGAAPGRA